MQLLLLVRALQIEPASVTNVIGTDGPNVDDQYQALQDYVRRWRWALRVSSRSAGGDKGLVNLSLLRIDALFTEWQIK